MIRKKRGDPEWVVMVDGGIKCLRCGKTTPTPTPMPAAAFAPWAEYVMICHAGCKDGGRKEPVPESVEEWVRGDDTGISSITIYRLMNGLDRRQSSFADHPHDPSDFGRCYRLLKLAPAWRVRIGEMAAYGREWAALVGAWDELEALYEKALADGSGKATALYDRMQKLEKEARCRT